METNSQPNATGDANAAELRRIASDIETYLSKWVVRSRRVIEHGLNATNSDVGISAQQQKFEEKQRKWEARRQREMDDVSDKAQELAAAWLKLESEQRQFLQMKEAWQHRTQQSGNSVPADPTGPATVQDASFAHDSQVGHAVPAPSPPAQPMPQQTPQSAPPSVPQYTPQVAPRMPAVAAYPGDRPACGNGRDAAIRQFEQLRREVGTKSRA